MSTEDTRAADPVLGAWGRAMQTVVKETEALQDFLAPLRSGKNYDQIMADLTKKLNTTHLDNFRQVNVFSYLGPWV